MADEDYITVRDSQWHQSIKKGDHDTFSLLFEAYYESLCIFSGRYVRLPEAREELVQDVFLWIWERRADWEPRGTVRSYLYRAVRNRCLNYLRDQRGKRGSEDELDGLATSQTALDDIQYVEMAEVLRSAIEELPERRRLVYSLRYLHHLSYNEIAVALNISVNTVDTQIKRSLKLVRERMRNYMDSSTVNVTSD